MLSLAGGLIGWGLAQLLTGAIRQMPGFIGEVKTLTILPPVAAMLLVKSEVFGYPAPG